MEPLVVPFGLAVVYCVLFVALVVFTVMAVVLSARRAAQPVVLSARRLNIASDGERGPPIAVGHSPAQAIMPDSLRKNKAEDMGVGETAYTWKANVWVDSENRVWILKEADVYRTKTKDLAVKLRRAEAGFDMQVSFAETQWDVGEYDILEDESIPITSVTPLAEREN